MKREREKDDYLFEVNTKIKKINKKNKNGP